MRKRSKKTLSKTRSLQGIASVCNSYDIVGDIAIAHLPESEEESQRIAETILKRARVDCEVSFARVVRSVGPNWYQVVLDVRVMKDGTM